MAPEPTKKHGRDRSSQVLDMAIFQIIHTNPSRLKRPLQQDDALVNTDIALRLYDILEQSGDRKQIRVRRRETAHDIACVDIIGSSDLHKLKRTLVQLQFVKSRVDCFLDALQPLVNANALPVQGASTYYEMEGDSDFLHRLEADGLVSSPSDGQWTLTVAAMAEYVELSSWLAFAEQPLFLSRRANMNLEDYSQMELEMLMDEQGWQKMSLGDAGNEELARSRPYQLAEARVNRFQS